MIAFPNAKINLGLYITAQRDDGYHNIETIMLPVNLCDVLELIPSPAFELVTSGIEIKDDIPSNICYKAFKLIQQDFNIPPVKIILQKNIPICAGMGGGSSDGTFTLRLLNDLFDLNINQSQLNHYAEILGSDCVFFVQNTPVFAKEKGNITEPVSLKLSTYYVTIIKTDIHISTAWAYAQVKPKTPEICLKDVIHKSPICEWKNFIFNDFEKPLFEKYSVLSEIKQELYSKGALYASMTGSGSAIYGISEKPLQVEFPNAFVWAGKFIGDF
jgi:4-diphosphocytidyl-2-C-methyl-D-erythritol kinase